MRTCVVCDKPLDSDKKPQAKYCGGTCSKRAQRAGLASRRGAGPPIATVAPRAVDPYVKLNTEFAAVLGASLSDGLLAALASDDDYRGDCTEEEFATVALQVNDRFQAAIRRADSDGLERLAGSLQALMDDLVDTRVVSYLAASLRDTDGGQGGESS